MTITDHPEFKEIMEDAYAKAYKHGQEDERERWAKIADSFFGCTTVIGPLFGAGISEAAQQIAAKIRSGL